MSLTQLKIMVCNYFHRIFEVRKNESTHFRCGHCFFLFQLYSWWNLWSLWSLHFIFSGNKLLSLRISNKKQTEKKTAWLSYIDIHPKCIFWSHLSLGAIGRLTQPECWAVIKWILERDWITVLMCAEWSPFCVDDHRSWVNT